jgi:hypothetical protein
MDKKHTIEGFKKLECAITFANNDERMEFVEWCNNNGIKNVDRKSVSIEDITPYCKNGVYIDDGQMVNMWMQLIGVPSVPYAEVFKTKECDEMVLDPETTASILSQKKKVKETTEKKPIPKEEILIIPQGNRTVALHKVDGKTVCTAYTDKHPDDEYSLAEGAKWATKRLAEKEAKEKYRICFIRCDFCDGCMDIGSTYSCEDEK